MILKWLFDLGETLLDWFFLLPTLLVVSFLIKIRLPGGWVLFAQKRMEKDGVLFDGHKFWVLTVKYNDSTRSVAETAA